MDPVQGSSPQKMLRVLGLYGLTFVLVPNAVVLLLGGVVYLVRPPLNVDYVLLAPLFAVSGALPTAVATGLLLALDLLQSILPGYHMSPQTAVESALEVSGLPPLWTVGVSGIGLVVVVGLSWLAGLGLERLPRRLVPAVALVGIVAATEPLEDGLQAPDGVFGVTLRQDVVTSPLVFLYNGLRSSRGSRSAVPLAVDVPAGTDSLFARLAAGRPLPDRILLVVVESLGLPRDSTAERLQRSALGDPRILQRYHVQVDTVPFRGSTVPGEIRELCRVRVGTVHPDPALLPPERCLPALLAERGFRTVAVHGFSGAFFRRASWYPDLGFDEVYLGAAVHRVTGSDERCGLAFVGACDGPVGDWIGRRLREPAPDRLFLYWLTLNAHSPAPAPDPARVHLSCDAERLGADICRLLAHHDVVMGTVADAALAPDLPPTLIIVVGDHPPHLVDPGSRDRIDGERVPALVLWPREDGPE